MEFRPCIDIHGGKVKQIVGSSLRDGAGAVENFVSEQTAARFAHLYQESGLRGGHVILLDQNEGTIAAAEGALRQTPGMLQVGGGIREDNGKRWLDAGASHVIVTSWLFPENRFSLERLKGLAQHLGAKNLVVDLSCRKGEDGSYRVACNRWQTLTELVVSSELLEELSRYCNEFLIHAVAVEGKKGGIDGDLVELLAASPIPVTYAGGIRGLEDVAEIGLRGQGRVNFTVGSALDLFGGELSYRDMLQWLAERRKNEK